MNVTDVRPNRVVEDLELTIVEKEEPRDVVTKYGKESRVCVAVAEDAEGNRVNLSLWDGEIARLIPSLAGVTYAELEQSGLCWPQWPGAWTTSDEPAPPLARRP